MRAPFGIDWPDSAAAASISLGVATVATPILTIVFWEFLRSSSITVGDDWTIPTTAGIGCAMGLAMLAFKVVRRKAPDIFGGLRPPHRRCVPLILTMFIAGVSLLTGVILWLGHARPAYLDFGLIVPIGICSYVLGYVPAMLRLNWAYSDWSEEKYITPIETGATDQAARPNSRERGIG